MLIRNDIKPESVLVIGTNQIGYAERRNFAYNGGSAFQIRQFHDGFIFLRKVWHRIFGIAYSRFLHSFAFPWKTSAAGFHYFNSILLRQAPWVVTYETTLPRYPEMPISLLRLAMRRLASANCGAIMAISESTKSRLIVDLAVNRARLNASEIESIKNKLQVLHPPQPVLTSIEGKLARCGFGGALRLVLVGHDFYRKGGLELLLAMDQLLGRGLKIHFTIVGRMVAGDYASRAGAEEVARANEIIARHSQSFVVRGMLDNAGVMELLKQSHVVCLPTWGETYGYSVLEGQAAGCSAITTDLRALPEINNEACGWVIRVPKLPNGDGRIATDEERGTFRTTLVSALLQAITEAHNGRAMLEEKARRSIERIKQFHSPNDHQRTLEGIYRKAFK